MSSYKLNEMKIFADVTEGIAVLINSDTGIYYGLNGFATNIYENIAIEDNFVLELKEYNDAQELLLADPIHEVKEETGWTGEKDSIIEDKELVKQKEAKVEQ